MNLHSASSGPAAGSLTSTERFLRAVQGKPVDRPPVWMMRQAGRYLKEYQAVRANFDFLDLCHNPDAAAEVSLQPLDIFGVDAVIVFNDILVPVNAMGVPLKFTEKGPVLTEPIREKSDLDRFCVVDFDHDESVFKTLSLLRETIGPDIALLGFAGAPFTLASYAIEGKLTRNLDIIKSLMMREPDLLHQILERTAETAANYLRLQIEAGVNLVQLFDTWAGSLSLEDYETFAHPYQKAVFDRVRPLGAPMTIYVNGSTPYLERMAEVGADVVSVDWRLPLDCARQAVGDGVALQGNLDPLILYGTPESVVKRTNHMLSLTGDGSHYIANLGHGILPQTPVESVRAFVETVKGWRP